MWIGLACLMIVSVDQTHSTFLYALSKIYNYIALNDHFIFYNKVFTPTSSVRYIWPLPDMVKGLLVSVIPRAKRSWFSNLIGLRIAAELAKFYMIRTAKRRKSEATVELAQPRYPLTDQASDNLMQPGFPDHAYLKPPLSREGGASGHVWASPSCRIGRQNQIHANGLNKLSLSLSLIHNHLRYHHQ